MSVACIIVSFHPQQSVLRALLDAIMAQVDLCVVVDNGSGPAIESMVEPYAGLHLRLLRLPDNQGSGVALNQGIELAIDNGVDHVLLMDQDSLPSPTMVAELLTVRKQLQAADVRVAAVGPRLLDRSSGRTLGFVRFGILRNHRVSCKPAQRSVETDFLMTSGSLIPVASLRELGLMDATLFIDHVDTEWLLRARAQGFRTFGACRATLQHDVGEFRVELPAIGVRAAPIHREFRYFYVFRNSVLLYRRSYVPWKWVVLDIFRLLRIMGFMLLMHPKRWHSLRMMFKGMAAGVLGRGGPLS